MALKALISYNALMSIIVSNYNENIAEEANIGVFHKVVDFLYGTRARTNRTIIVIFASIIAVYMLESMAAAPYCSV